MQTDYGKFVDLYTLWKCSGSNRLNAAKDHVSIQMCVAKLDRGTGRVHVQFRTYSICRAIRRIGQSRDSIL